MVSYAQQGEDMILHCLFHGHRTGFYVDVGAHYPHPLFQHLFLLHLRGWRGINIDAMPGSMAAFLAVRPEDINLECAIAEHTDGDNPTMNSTIRPSTDSPAHCPNRGALGAISADSDMARSRPAHSPKSSMCTCPPTSRSTS